MSEPLASEPTWSFDNARTPSRETTPQPIPSDPTSSFGDEPAHGGSAQAAEEESSRTHRRYQPRTCRICLDEVEPTFETPNLFGGKPRVRYVSEDPELGRLMLIMVLALFILGFVADPIINIWVDPAGAVSDVMRGGLDGFEEILEYIPDEEANTWFMHFSKGLVSLGLVGLVKVFLGFGPLHWINLRGGGGRRGRGRDRLENVSWVLVFIGVATFIGAVWKGVSAACARYLSQVSDDIIDVPGDDDNEDEDQEPQAESKKDQ
ncbi:hypothetical protein J7T55_006288 [Diaporthe amygdali]|uniref:uncharacterized protein n=1 Tax=Phomopsis amygdali TaxID=1214568 RepID=UPI0022FDFEBE|nr:uncharacterized protein J7T55_006288 [Diaporthe amygdali]KAJ0124945.1 hypothetical protein J7T55_006288 [Diaporthe amygdali]